MKINSERTIAPIDPYTFIGVRGSWMVVRQIRVWLNFYDKFFSLPRIPMYSSLFIMLETI